MPTIDDLTGVLDRGAWEAEAFQALRRAGERQQQLALILADLDRFKSVNDTYGHLAGDAVLRATGAALRDCGEAIVGRYGGHAGDEFLILVPEAGLDRALELAGRMRKSVRALAVRARTSRTATVTLTGQTVSMGIATGVPTGSPPEALADLLLDADVALRQAKRRGGDQVLGAGFDPAPGLTFPEVPPFGRSVDDGPQLCVPLAPYSCDTRHSATELVMSQAAAEHLHAVLAQLLGRTHDTVRSLR